MNLRQVIIYQVIILLAQVILYFGCEKFQKAPKNLDLPIDKRIPVIPLFTLIYILWFPLIALFPISLFKASPNLYKIYILAWILDIAISIVIYMVYPTTCTRPSNLRSLKGGWMLKIIYSCSYKGVNCAPSLHCSISTLVLIAAVLCTGMSMILRVVCSVIAFGIIISTMFTKQHVVVDVVTGVLLGVMTFGLASIII